MERGKANRKYSADGADIKWLHVSGKRSDKSSLKLDCEEKKCLLDHYTSASGPQHIKLFDTGSIQTWFGAEAYFGASVERLEAVQ
ncbi:hypothetical protein OUZ56_020864 [Daphnia magna]|uniref:Uncharacterized protein n=1 Tax=Daphnia magna TaxID=35525 RepID=A0ABQ9ZFQ1_9CRUS|nr:hypothetical protein OUZ56_020864 [Daphnia magna]